MLQTIHATSTTHPGPGTRTWAWPPTETEIRLRGICWTSLRPDANTQSDPPTIPPEVPPNPLTPEPPAHPVESPPSENPVPVREPSEVKPPVASLSACRAAHADRLSPKWHQSRNHHRQSSPRRALHSPGAPKLSLRGSWHTC